MEGEGRGGREERGRGGGWCGVPIITVIQFF